MKTRDTYWLCHADSYFVIVTSCQLKRRAHLISLAQKRYPSFLQYSLTQQYTHTTVLRLYGFCPGQPGWFLFEADRLLAVSNNPHFTVFNLKVRCCNFLIDLVTQVHKRLPSELSIQKCNSCFMG